MTWNRYLDPTFHYESMQAVTLQEDGQLDVVSIPATIDYGIGVELPQQPITHVKLRLAQAVLLIELTEHKQTSVVNSSGIIVNQYNKPSLRSFLCVDSGEDGQHKFDCVSEILHKPDLLTTTAVASLEALRQNREQIIQVTNKDLSTLLAEAP